MRFGWLINWFILDMNILYSNLKVKRDWKYKISLVSWYTWTIYLVVFDYCFNINEMEDSEYKKNIILYCFYFENIKIRLKIIIKTNLFNIFISIFSMKHVFFSFIFIIWLLTKYKNQLWINLYSSYKKKKAENTGNIKTKNKIRRSKKCN